VWNLKVLNSKMSFMLSEYGNIINDINNSVGKNICLRTVLIISDNQDRNTIEYKSYRLNVQLQPEDIYNYENILTDPAPEIELSVEPFINDFTNNIESPKMTFLIVYEVIRGGRQINSHVNLGIKLNDLIYRYDSGLSNDNFTCIMDSQFIRAMLLVPYSLKIMSTLSWCPYGLQGNTNSCSLYSLYIYKLLLTTDKTIDEIKHFKPSKDFLNL